MLKQTQNGSTDYDNGLSLKKKILISNSPF